MEIKGRIRREMRQDLVRRPPLKTAVSPPAPRAKRLFQFDWRNRGVVGHTSDFPQRRCAGKSTCFPARGRARCDAADGAAEGAGNQ